VSLPREDLVPFGGAAPVDVYIAVAAEHAIVCVVMASWAEQRAVTPSLKAGIDVIEPILLQASKRRGKGGKRMREALRTLPDSRAATTGRTKRASTLPPAAKRRGAMAGLVSLTGSGAAASSLARRPAPVIKSASEAPPSWRTSSTPTIDVGEAAVGRETAIAIDADERRGMGPPLGSPLASAPDVRVELVSMGRATDLDLRREEAARMQSLADARPSDPVLPSTDRMTQPWVEPAADAKRSVDAARGERKVAAPRVTLRLEDADGEVFEAMLLDDPPAAAPAPKDAGPPRAPKPSLDIWKEAITEPMDQRRPKR
jgi:hypothetical protein